MVIPSQCYIACVDGRNVQTGKPLKYQVIAVSAIRQCVETRYRRGLS